NYMKKYNLFDNFICLLIGSIIGIFLYINFFVENNKELKIIKQNNQPIEIINEIKKKLMSYNTQTYLYKKDIENILNNL
ncbi:hypothetical protein KEC49_02635, partial ['Elaeagnus angustifolia' witches'-broom phytoplasma]|nr:hypothetical protein ['Elaeagnus angustifolia' witches'-broom phytoplasma]MCX2955931.1 hypothetical protein [Candidatus Phytoplasma australiense]